jgi:hypothetical protein
MPLRATAVLALRAGWDRAKAKDRRCEGCECPGSGAHDEAPYQQQDFDPPNQA